MAAIEKSIRLQGSKGERQAKALFDRTATYSCIRPELAQELATPDPLPKAMDFETAARGRKLRVLAHACLFFYLNGERFSDEFMVMEGLSDDAIIGAKTLRSWRISLDFSNDQVLYPKADKPRT